MNLMALTALRMRTATMLAMMMVVMFASPSGAWAQNAGVVATVKSTGQQQPVEYTDLEAAFAAAKDNDEITLLANCNLVADDTHTGKLVVGNGTDPINVKFDLNGHKVEGLPNEQTVSVDELITVTTKAYLTIVDVTGSGIIATSGETAILNVGVLTLSGGEVRGSKYGIYSQGNVAISGGSVIGDDCALYVEQGMANISGGYFNAGDVGIFSQSNLYFLGLPTFGLNPADISLAQDKKIEFNSGSYAVPANKIRVKLANEAPYMFTSNYKVVTDAADNPIDPEDVFVSVDYGEGVIGYVHDSYYMTDEAGIAEQTTVTFPAGTSIYFDSRALALHEKKDNLKFYGIKGLTGSTVQLGEFTSKKFGEHSAVIVSNTSDDPITAQMVVAFEGPMASSFGNAANADLGVQDFPPVFLDGTDVDLTKIIDPDVFPAGYEVFGFSDNRFLFLDHDAGAAAHSGWLVADMSKVPDIGYLTILWPDGKTTGELIAMDSPVNLENNGTTQAYYPLTNDVALKIVSGPKNAYSSGVYLNRVMLGVAKSEPEFKSALILGCQETNKGKKAVLKVAKKQLQGGKLQLATVLQKGTTLMIIVKGGKLKLSSSQIRNLKRLLKKEGIKVTKIKTVSATRAATLDDDDEELVLDPDVEYEVLEDCNLFFDVEFDDDADELEIEGVTFRNPGDANGDDKVDAADIVEMENAKAGNPSERFVHLNADIDDDDDITDDDVDVVVDLIVDE